MHKQRKDYNKIIVFFVLKRKEFIINEKNKKINK